MTDNIHQFPIQKKPQEEAMSILQDLSPDNMFVMALKDGEGFYISSFDDIYAINYILDQIKIGILFGEEYEE